MPEVFFNETKDELSQIVIEDMKSIHTNNGGSSTSTAIPNQIHLLRRK